MYMIILLSKPYIAIGTKFIKRKHLKITIISNCGVYVFIINSKSSQPYLMTYIDDDVMWISILAASIKLRMLPG